MDEQATLLQPLTNDAIVVAAVRLDVHELVEPHPMHVVLVGPAHGEGVQVRPSAIRKGRARLTRTGTRLGALGCAQP